MTSIDRERQDLARQRAAVAASKAEDLLAHYLRSAWEAAGLAWTDDNDAEAREITTLIIDAAQAAAES